MHRLFASLLLLLPLGVLAARSASTPPPPQQDSQVHVGARSCAGSSCHGASQRWQRWERSEVKQDEYLTWQRRDKHAMAYEILLNERSQRIAANLGLDKAHEAELCLDCHADNVPTERRGSTFRINAGVSCEACHGGARNWLSKHMSNKDHAANLRAGMYPTEDPVARAQLCLSCHGGGDKRVRHEVMGAGHPRISFELDTFTAIQPAHFVVDRDYRKRKGSPSAVRTWAVGQTVAARQTLDDLQDPELMGSGLFPELTLFDCHTCHDPMEPSSYKARPGQKPGVPRLQDANLLMVTVLARLLDPALGEELDEGSRVLHRAASKGPEALAIGAAALDVRVARVQALALERDFGEEDQKALLRGLVSLAEGSELTRYAAAEQATMAASSVLSGLFASGSVDEGKAERLRVALEACYEAVDEDVAWKPEGFVVAMRGLGAAL